MRFLDIAFGVILLVLASWGAVRWVARKRRELAEAEAERQAALAAARALGGGDDHLGGASGADARSDGPVMIDGVTIQVSGAAGRGAAVALRVELPAGARRLRLDADAQGLERKKKSLVLGLPGVDARLDVRGDRADAMQLFGHARARSLVDAIGLHGWRLVRGELVHAGVTPDALDASLHAGAAAGRLLVDVATGAS